jgi:hypothetical protein
MRNAYVLVGISEGEEPLGRPRPRRENGIKMDLRERVWEVDCIHLVEERQVASCRQHESKVSGFIKGGHITD